MKEETIRELRKDVYEATKEVEHLTLQLMEAKRELEKAEDLLHAFETGQMQ